MIKTIIKRDGRKVLYDQTKIANAVLKAMTSTKEGDAEDAARVANAVEARIESAHLNDSPGIEFIQDAVEKELMNFGFNETAKAYILYRANRTRAREANTSLMRTIDEITQTDAKLSDLKRDNANVDGNTPMGSMLQIGAAGAKAYNEMYLLRPEHAKAFRDGYLYIHDFDFYSMTTTCTQIDILKLFHGGFSTGHGFLREPQSIQSYASLAAIAIQSNQNDQHGGQSIPNFDYGMAEGIRKSYRKNFIRLLTEALEDYFDKMDLAEAIKDIVKKTENETDTITGIGNDLKFDETLRKNLSSIAEEEKKIRHVIERVRERALKATDRDTYQAMESFVHNLNTMHCLPASERIWVRRTDTKEVFLITMQKLHDTFKPGLYEALSVNPETGISEFKAITATADQGSHRRLVTIHAKSGQEVTVTDNHKVLSVDKETGKIYKDIPEKIDTIIIPRKRPKISSTNEEIHLKNYTNKKPRIDTPFKGETLILTEDLAYLLGVYVGDGSLTANDSTTVISSCNKFSVEFLSSLVNRVLNTTISFTPRYMADGRLREVRFNTGAYFGDFVKHICGATAVNKKVPSFIYTASNSIQQAFINGYRDTDGRKGAKYNEMVSVSKELISGINFLICCLGELPCLNKRSGNKAKFQTNNDFYGLTIGFRPSVRAGISMAENISVACEIPRYDLSFVRNLCEKPQAFKRRHSNAVRIHELEEELHVEKNNNLNHLVNIFNVPITSKVMSNSGDEHVYDISVQDNENFVTESMIVVSNSRAGAQTPFSSINYGTDTSPEGRMAIRNVLLALDAGLGHGETCIFPIHIFKVKEGVNYNPGDPNYDLFRLSCKVSAKRLFPNFVFLDSPYNLQYYKPGHPETEVATMGCRTRVMGNVYDPEHEIAYSRGNLSFSSINLVRLALESEHDEKTFYEKLDKMLELTAQQLLDRFEIQASKHVYNFPFLMGQGVWLDSDKLSNNDELREVLKHGTLSIGFIGLAETLTALYGKHHGESEEVQKKGLEIIGHMRDFCNKKSQEMKMNFTLLATPAEGLSGKFIRKDQQRFGKIKGITDREYYTNSFHIPVWFPISAFDKIRLEAPYHALCNAGHISYVEMDGDTSRNVEAFEQIVRWMHDCEIGYGSINHPVDRDPVCGYVGVIGDVCPRCGRREGEQIPQSEIDRLKKMYPEMPAFQGIE